MDLHGHFYMNLNVNEPQIVWYDKQNLSHDIELSH